MMNDAAAILIWSTFGASAFVSVMCLINLLFFRKAAATAPTSPVIPAQSVIPAQAEFQTAAMDSRLRGNDDLEKRTPDKAANSSSRAIQISVLIPARNEALRIGPLLDSVLASEGVHCEICVLDDESQDGTDAIVQVYSDKHSNVRLLKGDPVPAGWSGKQFACYQLAQHATFDELVFLDADVALSKDCLLRSVTLRKKTGDDLLSGFPHQRVVTFGEQLLIPMIHLILLCFLPFALMRWTRMVGAAAGCGQFFLTTKQAYHRSGGHSAIRQSLHDGIMLPRAYRIAGLKTDLFDASDIASCRMYTTFEETWSGLLKNAAEGFAKMPLLPVMTILMLLAFVSPLLCALGIEAGIFSDVYLAPVVMSCVLSYLSRVICCARFDHAWLACVVHPVSIVLFLAIQWTAWFQKSRGQSVHWRQRSYEIATS